MWLMTATIQTLCCCGGAGRCGNHRTPIQHHSLHSSCHCRQLACVDTGLPPIELAPELVLFGILPPLIYSAGVAMSWFSTCARSRCWHLVRCTTLASASPA